MSTARIVILSVVIVSIITGWILFWRCTTPLVASSGRAASGGSIASSAVVTFSEKFRPLILKGVQVRQSEGQIQGSGSSFQRVPLLDDGGEGMVARLNRILPVDTSFGGAFVARIAGLPTTSRQGSWLYYVDGVLSNRGFSEFRPEAVRHIRWDLHPTELHTISALVGDYPLPFASQYPELKKTVEIYSLPPHELVAESLRNDLNRRGVAAKVIHISDAVVGPNLSGNSHKIVLGRVDELAGMAVLSSLLNDKEKSGLSVNLVQGYPLCIDRWHGGDKSSDDNSHHSDDSGNSTDCITEGAAVFALAQPVNMAALWVVTGIGADDLKRGVEALIAGRLSDMSAAWVRVNSDLMNLPRE